MNFGYLFLVLLQRLLLAPGWENAMAGRFFLLLLKPIENDDFGTFFLLLLL